MFWESIDLNGLHKNTNKGKNNIRHRKSTGSLYLPGAFPGAKDQLIKLHYLHYKTNKILSKQNCLQKIHNAFICMHSKKTEWFCSVVNCLLFNESLAFRFTVTEWINAAQHEQQRLSQLSSNKHISFFSVFLQLPSPWIHENFVCFI